MTTAYTYDVQHNLKTVTVADVLVASIDYDLLGRRTAITEGNSGTTSFELDGLGQITEQFDAKAQVTQFSYDRLGRPTQRIDGFGSSGSSTSTWAWDGSAGDGRLRQRSNGQFTETLAYDSLGRVTSSTTAINVAGLSGLGPWTVSHGYDSAGRPISTTFPGNVTVSQIYNTRGYLAQVKRGSTVLEDYQQVDAFGHVTQQTLHNGNMTTSRTVDSNS
ncbi:MAG: hypothetical protein JJT88_10565, partial [Gammaproteobacteria bacterium]|nr:hypothetical protein [Gammaproteobacteria bacterium]